MSRQQRRDLDATLRRIPKEFKPEPIATMRSNFAVMMSHMRVPDGVRRTPASLGGRPAILVEPDTVARPGTILYFHGGSYALGSPDTAMSLTANLVARTGIKALSLDYRLAPEHPFPAAIHDGLAAYRELLDGGHDPASIAFAGDSAGGGLSVTVCLALRDAGLPQPAGILTFSAGLDMTRSGASMTTKADADPMFTQEGLQSRAPCTSVPTIRTNRSSARRCART